MPCWPSCLPLLLLQELWFASLRAPASPACSSRLGRDCCLSPHHHLPCQCHSSLHFLSPSLVQGKRLAREDTASLQGAGLSLVSWALPTPLLLYLGQALPRGAVCQEPPRARLRPQLPPLVLPSLPHSPGSQDHPNSERGRWGVQLLIAMAHVELEVCRVLKPF